ERGEPAVRFEKDLLSHVVGVLFADGPRHPTMDRGRMAANELPESVLLSLLREEDELFVGQLRQAQVQIAPPLRCGRRDCTRAIRGILWSRGLPSDGDPGRERTRARSRVPGLGHTDLPRRPDV